MRGINDIDRFAFVVGAPRCGTTSISSFLKAHPQVCFPLVKEPHFFAQHDLRHVPDAELRARVERDYLERFYGGCAPQRRVAADCSVSYLYTPEQLEPALRLWPRSRFIVALRDPMAMLPSLHRRLTSLGDEDIRSFAEAWAAIEDRKAGKRIPRSCVDPRWLRYDEAGRYGSYVERLFAAVGRDRCLVVLFDDFATNPVAEYRRIMTFLGLPSFENSIDFSPQRKSFDVRLPWLQRLLKRPPKQVRKYLAGTHYRHRERALKGDLADSGLVDAIFALRKRILRWNRAPYRPEVISAALREEIRRRLKPEIERLEQLIGRDLGHWLDTADSPAKMGGTPHDSQPLERPRMTASR